MMKRLSKKKDKHQKKDETRGRKPLPPRFVDEEDEVDNIEMEDVPENESTQTTDQILVFADFEVEEAAIETVQVPEEVPVTRKRGRPRKSTNVETSSNIVRRSTRKNS